MMRGSHGCEISATSSSYHRHMSAGGHWPVFSVDVSSFHRQCAVCVLIIKMIRLDMQLAMFLYDFPSAPLCPFLYPSNSCFCVIRLFKYSFIQAISIAPR